MTTIPITPEQLLALLDSAERWITLYFTEMAPEYAPGEDFPEYAPGEDFPEYAPGEDFPEYETDLVDQQAAISKLRDHLASPTPTVP